VPLPSLARAPLSPSRFCRRCPELAVRRRSATSLLSARHKPPQELRLEVSMVAHRFSPLSPPLALAIARRSSRAASRRRASLSGHHLAIRTPPSSSPSPTLAPRPNRGQNHPRMLDFEQVRRAPLPQASPPAPQRRHAESSSPYHHWIKIQRIRSQLTRVNPPKSVNS
jgi:hypothetical protein